MKFLLAGRVYGAVYVTITFVGFLVAPSSSAVPITCARNGLNDPFMPCNIANFVAVVVERCRLHWDVSVVDYECFLRELRGWLKVSRRWRR